MATPIYGKYGKVTIGTNPIALMGQWSMPGVSADSLESTSFGDEWKQFKMGLKDGGQITFSGLYDPTDAHQTSLRTYNADNTEVTTLRLYIDNTSYFVPTTTNPVSYVQITAWEIGMDKAGLGTASFTAKVSGKMELI